MHKETIAKVREVMDGLGIHTIHIQCDNSNFYSEGTTVERNCVLFDDNNEMAWGVRRNDNFAQPDGEFRITCFDYDTIQFITMEASAEGVQKFIELIAPDCENVGDAVKEYQNKFKRNKYDKRRYYGKNPGANEAPSV